MCGNRLKFVKCKELLLCGTFLALSHGFRRGLDSFGRQSIRLS